MGCLMTASIPSVAYAARNKKVATCALVHLCSDLIHAEMLVTAPLLNFTILTCRVIASTSALLRTEARLRT